MKALPLFTWHLAGKYPLHGRHRPRWRQWPDGPCRAGASLSISLATETYVLSSLSTFLQGLACGSDTAHMSMFGYDPRTHYRLLNSERCLHVYLLFSLEGAVLLSACKRIVPRRTTNQISSKCL
jgi:hypothetical protein